jgi:hypothetical protein
MDQASHHSDTDQGRDASSGMVATHQEDATAAPGAMAETRQREAPHVGPVSIWPFTMAAAIALGASTLVLNWFVFVAAAIVFVFSLHYWMSELLHEREQHEH